MEKVPDETRTDNEAVPNEKSETALQQTFDSGSTLSPKKESESSSNNASKTALSLDDDALFAHLPQHEKDILKKQLDAPEVKMGFVGLYRYADHMDILILVISALCAIAAGAALPLFTVSTGHCDRNLINPLIGIDSLWFVDLLVPRHPIWQHSVQCLLRRSLQERPLLRLPRYRRVCDDLR